MALYELDLHQAGELIAYRRTWRYIRGRADSANSVVTDPGDMAEDLGDRPPQGIGGGSSRNLGDILERVLARPVAHRQRDGRPELDEENQRLRVRITELEAAEDDPDA